MKQYTEEELLTIVQEIEEHFRKNNYTSYDPCDIKALPLFLWWDKFFGTKKIGIYAQFPMNLLISNFAGIIRLLFGVKKRAFAQSHALFLRSYLVQFSITKDESLLEKARLLWDYIFTQKSDGWKNLAWGQPYPWYSQKVIPAFTPRTTVTSQILHTMIDLYISTSEERFIPLIKATSKFFLEEMPRSFENKNETCFSYTTIDSYRVYNANMMAAWALIRAGTLLDDQYILNLGNSCLSYSMKRQNRDGSWYYFELADSRKSKIDHYHTGYILEALAEIKGIQGPEFKYDDQFIKGIEFYADNFFQDGIIPKMTPGSLFPIDIQSCAQSILTLTSMGSFRVDCLDRAHGVLDYTIENFYSGKGYFHYRKNNRGLTRKISYIRWGDAWMYLAIVKYLTTKKNA